MTTLNQAEHQRLTDMLPDYLNGHLSARDAAHVEAALETSESLRKQLQFEQQLQHSLRTESKAAESALGSAAYDSIRDRIEAEPKSIWQWRMPYVGAIAPLALLAIVVLQFDTQPSPHFDARDIETNQQFETRTDDPQAYDQPTLRVLFDEPLALPELEQWLSEQQLELVDDTASPRRMLEVTSTRDANELALLVSQLEADQRIQAVKVMNSGE